MVTFDEDVAARIAKACEHFDEAQARAIVKDLVNKIRQSAIQYPAEQAVAALKPLRRKRYFEPALQLADAVLESGQRDPRVRQFYLQALVDTERLAAAIPYAKTLIDDTKGNPKAQREALGLLGRAWKQLYVNGAGEEWKRTEYLRSAFETYHRVYADPDMEDTDWHAMNALALMHRAKKDNVALPKVEPFAKPFYDAARAKVTKKNADEWGLATAGEAALAVGNHKSAVKFYTRYAQGENLDAFEIFSSLRQLIEVWRLTDTEPPGCDILPRLRGALLKREGGAVRVAADTIGRERAAARRAVGEEKMFGGRVKSATWYRNGLRCCKAVCRIQTLNDSHVATGFLVRGSDFHDDLGDELLVLTNHHVISDSDPDAKPAKAVHARFEALSTKKKYLFHPKIVWSDPALDATLVRFRDDPPPAKPYEVANNCPTCEEGRKPPRIYVIGHPFGWELSFSLHDNELIASDGKRLHYRSPTEQGSSGSPLFDDDWNLIGLHRRGQYNIERIAGMDKPYDANEGFWIGSIQKKCRRSRRVRPRR